MQSLCLGTLYFAGSPCHVLCLLSRSPPHTTFMDPELHSYLRPGLVHVGRESVVNGHENGHIGTNMTLEDMSQIELNKILLDEA